MAEIQEGSKVAREELHPLSLPSDHPLAVEVERLRLRLHPAQWRSLDLLVVDVWRLHNARMFMQNAQGILLNGLPGETHITDRIDQAEGVLHAFLSTEAGNPLTPSSVSDRSGVVCRPTEGET